MAQPIKVSVSTQIRNIYSEGVACLNLRFYNNTLSLSFYPFTGKDNNNRNQYDSRHGQMTTINYEAAYGLYKLGVDILNGVITECNYSIPCLGATLIFERKPVGTEYETVLSITKNNVTIPFKFSTTEYQTKDANGQMVTKQLESTLGTFVMTLDGFLTGINADLHLNKLTSQFAQAQDERSGKNRQPQPQMNQPMQQQQYMGQQPNNGYRPSPQYNQRRGYNQPRPYNNYGPAQNLNDYQIQG